MGLRVMVKRKKGKYDRRVRMNKGGFIGEYQVGLIRYNYEHEFGERRVKRICFGKGLDAVEQRGM